MNERYTIDGSTSTQISKTERKEKEAQKRYQVQNEHREKRQKKLKTKRIELAKEGEVVIKGVDIPFYDLMVLLIKLSLASIPAALIVAMVGVAFVTVFSGFLGALGR